MTRNRFAIALAVALAACGGEAGQPDEMAQAPDSSITPIERVPLTEADLVDLEMADLAIEVPWTGNQVDRAPEPSAPRVLVESAAVTGHEGFDRMLFTFSEDAPFPGYRVGLVEAGEPIPCGRLPSESETSPEGSDEAPDAAATPEIAGSRVLALRIDPARVAEDGVTTIPVGTDGYEHARVVQAGVLCAEENVVTWVAGLTQGTDVRVLEMRSPHRLVVDVR